MSLHLILHTEPDRNQIQDMFDQENLYIFPSSRAKPQARPVLWRGRGGSTRGHSAPGCRVPKGELKLLEKEIPWEMFSLSVLSAMVLISDWQMIKLFEKEIPWEMFSVNVLYAMVLISDLQNDITSEFLAR